MNHATPYVLPFTSVNVADLSLVGGKGASLGEMTRAGFPVPPGFCLTTAAFRRFIATCQDADTLYADLAALEPGDVTAARQVGEQVRQTLRALPIPDDVAVAILDAWRRQGTEYTYAVRSSATAEDLPDASFAGQQDTFLNVCGEAALLEAVRNCWLSLFTDRAILYRLQNHFDHRDVLLAVVVQRMVLPERSGILFTADPVSGNRHIISIDASFGLGEALVAGLVTADLVRVDKRTFQIIDVHVADKQVAIRPLPGGGTVQETLVGAQRTMRALSDEQAILLAEIGARLEKHYGRPQDVEWAVENGKIYLVQSRPITSLYPLPPEAQPDGPLQALFSFGAVQGMLDPMTPLGRDMIRGAFAGAAALFGYHHLTAATQRVLLVAGERLFINVTPVVRHPLGRRILRQALELIEPSTAQAMQSLRHEPALASSPGWFKWPTVIRVGRFLVPIIRRLLRILRHPERQRQQVQQWLDALVDEFEQRAAAATTLAERVRLLEDVQRTAFPAIASRLVPIIAGGMAALNLLNQLAENRSDTLILTRGLPHNVTTEMDLALWQTAQIIQADPEAAAAFAQQAAAQLAADFLAGQLPPVAQTAVADFLRHYGMRGVAEIDLGRPRWREAPTPVMQALQSYLQIDDPNHAPDAVFQRGATAAEAAITRLATAVRRARFGWLKAYLVRAAARRLRALAGLRESPKFFIIRLMGIVRAGLLASGRELAQQGILQQPDDLFFLHQAELQALAQDERRNWRGQVAERRLAYERELKRRQIPRLLLSDGRAFYEGVSAPAGRGDGVLTGSPVSPGIIEGRAHVVFDPHHARLAPGEILVCPGTDPAWTPLFLAAGGLVTEVGGLMTHGSVVAREYGIPAVVGVHQATQKIRTGQLIRVHGDQGYVELLPTPPDDTALSDG